MLHYGDAITWDGASGYAPVDQLQAAWDGGQCRRSWALGGRLMSVQLSNGSYWKTRERLTTDEPQRLLGALDVRGVHHPSSYADCYHQLAPRMPRVRRTINALFDWWPGGPWSEALQTGTFTGRWYRYDLQSAYRWAATLGLPTIDSMEVTKRRTPSRPGLWLVRLEEDRPDLPPVYRQSGELAVVATDEVERYNLKCETIRGVVWRDTHDRLYVERTLQRLPCPKESGRAYWGRWIARDPLTCRTKSGAEWTMPNMSANFVWGWLIVGRVRLRLWEVAKEAAHVYVDEVLVPHELPTAFGVGHWHLKEEYPRGVYVNRTGWYGSRRRTTMHTGHPHP
jgi:hypothetical protein